MHVLNVSFNCAISCVAFCVVCSFVMFVVDAIGDYIMDYYGSVCCEQYLLVFAPLGLREDLSIGIVLVVNVFVTSEFKIEGGTQYFGRCVHV